MRSIKADTTFLRKKGIMDYSLLLICEEIDHDDEADIFAHFNRNSIASHAHGSQPPTPTDKAPHDEEDVIEG